MPNTSLSSPSRIVPHDATSRPARSAYSLQSHFGDCITSRYLSLTKGSPVGGAVTRATTSAVVAKPTATLISWLRNNRCKGRTCTTNQAEDTYASAYSGSSFEVERNHVVMASGDLRYIYSAADVAVVSSEPAYSPQRSCFTSDYLATGSRTSHFLQADERALSHSPARNVDTVKATQVAPFFSRP